LPDAAHFGCRLEIELVLGNLFCDLNRVLANGAECRRHLFAAVIGHGFLLSSSQSVARPDCCKPASRLRYSSTPHSPASVVSLAIRSASASLSSGITGNRALSADKRATILSCENRCKVARMRTIIAAAAAVVLASPCAAQPAAAPDAHPTFTVGTATAQRGQKAYGALTVPA